MFCNLFQHPTMIYRVAMCEWCEPTKLCDSNPKIQLSYGFAGILIISYPFVSLSKQRNMSLHICSHDRRPRYMLNWTMYTQTYHDSSLCLISEDRGWKQLTRKLCCLHIGLTVSRGHILKTIIKLTRNQMTYITVHYSKIQVEYNEYIKGIIDYLYIIGFKTRRFF